ncbi:hypothetical protein L2E82_01050 [Cichorium intybus]|uniref:Uncharacterized protein n=1 Tax=Cichorium intybus TaxID=13427 RepID=A0ACB9GYX2_CICIN|nr:hypothetical protein L2E82_01050 [Cichorium intybus]
MESNSLAPALRPHKPEGKRRNEHSRTPKTEQREQKNQIPNFQIAPLQAEKISGVHTSKNKAIPKRFLSDIGEDWPFGIKGLTDDIMEADSKTKNESMEA